MLDFKAVREERIAYAELVADLTLDDLRGLTNEMVDTVEVPWQTMTTVAQCRQRLEGSRRMRLASLEMWPDEPHLDNAYAIRSDAPPVNAIGRFILGLMHADDHLDHIAEIVHQARAARS